MEVSGWNGGENQRMDYNLGKESRRERERLRDWERERERELKSKISLCFPFTCLCMLSGDEYCTSLWISLFLFLFLSLSLSLCPHREWCGHKFVPHISFPKFWRKETKLKQTDKIETNLFSIQLFNDRDRKKRKY